MNKTSLISVIFIFSSLVAGSVQATNKSSPFAGLSDEQYSLCIDLGSQVMNNMNKYGLDSSKHKSSYYQWDSKCSLKALWGVVMRNENAVFPSSPMDWANRK